MEIIISFNYQDPSRFYGKPLKWEELQVGADIFFNCLLKLSRLKLKSFPGKWPYMELDNLLMMWMKNFS